MCRSREEFDVPFAVPTDRTGSWSHSDRQRGHFENRSPSTAIATHRSPAGPLHLLWFFSLSFLFLPQYTDFIRELEILLREKFNDILSKLWMSISFMLMVI